MSGSPARACLCTPWCNSVVILCPVGVAYPTGGNDGCFQIDSGPLRGFASVYDVRFKEVAVMNGRESNARKLVSWNVVVNVNRRIASMIR
jgi:hypothetical protein